MTKKQTKKTKKAHKLTANKRTLVAVSVCVLVVLGALFYARWQAVHSRAAYPLKVWSQGDTVQSRNISFRVNEVRTDENDVPGHWELPEGMQFAIINITFTNKTDSAYQLSPINTMYIQDVSNKRYEVSSAPSITLPFGGELAAGQSVTGEVGLVVPKTISTAQFVFDPRTPGDPLILTNVVLQKPND